MTKFNVLEFIANNAGLSIAEAIEKAYELGKTEIQQCEGNNPNCTECRYYDKEKHHCPRFCQVIENTMAEITSEQTRWIPCSERLPEITDTYYMTTVDYEKHGLAIGPRYYHGDLGWEDDCVIAWMPLPEPYKAESEDKE